MLHVYSKCCRIFLDNAELKMEYQKEAEKYGTPFPVSWKNAFDFEVYDQNVLKLLYDESKALSDNEMNNLEQKLNGETMYFTMENLKLQKFSLGKNLMHYILQNSNSEVLQKLFLSCKFFFAKNPIPVCYKLIWKGNVFESSLHFNQQSMEVFNRPPTEPQFQNLYISTYLWVQFQQNNAVSNLIPNLFRCDAKYVTIFNQNLTENELKFLIGSGNVQDLNLNEVKVTDSNGAHLPLESILVMVPKVLSVK